MKKIYATALVCVIAIVLMIILTMVIPHDGHNHKWGRRTSNESGELQQAVEVVE